MSSKELNSARRFASQGFHDSIALITLLWLIFKKGKA
jgi:hypothetical protein